MSERMISKVLVLGLAGVLSVSCGTSSVNPLREGMVVTGSDLRVGLTADDQLGSPPGMVGGGFEKLTGNTYVASRDGGVIAGVLADRDNAIAVAKPRSIWVLGGSVVAKPGAAASRSDARVVEISTMDLAVAGKLPRTRVVVESVLTPSVAGSAFALYELEAELSFDGTEMARTKADYAVYPAAEAGMVEIYRGRRGSGRSVKMATVRDGTAYTVTDPSFYGDLGAGAHKLVFTLKLSAGSPQHAGLEGRSGEVGLDVVSRLKVEGRPALSAP